MLQPAEEGLAGGRVMVEEGLFERFPADAVYGLHNTPAWRRARSRYAKVHSWPPAIVGRRPSAAPADMAAAARTLPPPRRSPPRNAC